MYHELTDRFVVSSPLSGTWEFFGTAANLSRITPSWLGFTTRSSDTKIGQDALLDYTIKWMGVPIRWRTKIIDWDPPRQFTDLQVRGPYALWHHQHTFREVEGGVECSDRVIYRVPVPLVGRVVHAAIVRRQLLGIFRHRRKVIGEQLGWVRAVQDDVTVRPL